MQDPTSGTAAQSSGHQQHQHDRHHGANNSQNQNGHGGSDYATQIGDRSNNAGITAGGPGSKAPSSGHANTPHGHGAQVAANSQGAAAGSSHQQHAAGAKDSGGNGRGAQVNGDAHQQTNQATSNNTQKNHDGGQGAHGHGGTGTAHVPTGRNDKSNNQKKGDNTQQTITIGHYILGKHLGKGTFGQVKLGQHTLTGEKVAIKILEKDKINDQKDVERITREIKILKKVRHPNVIQLYEIIETEKELYMIMEYCSGGELFDYIVRHTRLSEKQACKFYLELISGIEYIHQSGVCHRDLKPENLLLDYDLTLKIVDFGLSNMYEMGATLKTACGSPCYAAPEMIAGKRYHGLKTDIWSSGVVFYAMVCGYLPFEDPKTSNLYKKIMGAEYTLPKFLSGQCKDIIRRILNTDPEQRYGVNEIRNHTWSLLVKDRNRDQGLFPGKEKMPVEEKLFNKIVEEFNFDRKYAQKCIEDNRHNHITACYHLIDRRNKKLKDRQESYQQSKLDFKRKMKMPTTIKEAAQVANEVQNKTVMQGERNSINTSPVPYIPNNNNKQDLNMTAPLHSDQQKGRKLNEVVGSPMQNVGKIRDNSIDYSTIQHNTGGQKGINIQNHQQYGAVGQNDRIAAYHRRAQTRGMNQIVAPIGDSKSPDKYTINKNLVVNLNDSAIKPVKRENSNTTNTTHVTGVTASTAGTQNTKNNSAFYNTQYKGVGKTGAPGTFFPSTTNGSDKQKSIFKEYRKPDQMTDQNARNTVANNYMNSDGGSSNYEEVSQKIASSQQQRVRQQQMATIQNGGMDGNSVHHKMGGGRFRSIQAPGSSHMSKQQAMIHNVNFNLVNQNQAAAMAGSSGGGQHNPNHSIDIGQLPMRLVTQKNTQRKQNLVPGGAAPNGRNGQNQYNQTLINGMMQISQQDPSDQNNSDMYMHAAHTNAATKRGKMHIGSHGNGQGQNQKNAWHSLDASSIGGNIAAANQNAVNQGLMIQPCSNQAQNLITGQPTKLDIQRPSVTQGGNNPGTAGGQRSPRGTGMKNQFYAVHGRGMSIQNTGNGSIDHSSMPTSTKGILTKIFKNQHNRQAMQNQNYIDHMNQTHGNMAFQGRGSGATNIIKQLKSPNNNLREHLHTQGRARAQNQTLETGPAGSLGTHQRGGSLNIQDLYQKRSISGSSQQGLKGRNQQVRNVTYYSNKNTGGGPPQQYQNFNQQIDHSSLPAHHNNYVAHNSVINSPNGGGNGSSGVETGRLGTGQGNNNNIFVPGTMRFANMNRGGKAMNDSVISNGTTNSLTAQQQKIFEMTSNHHAVGVIGGITSPSAGGQAPSMATAFSKNGSGPNSQMAGAGGGAGQMGNMLPSNKQAYSKHQQAAQPYNIYN